jgi:hypothetical protein
VKSFRGFIEGAFIALVSLSAFGETVRVVSISNDQWTPRLVVSSTAGATTTVTNCPTFGGFPGDTGDKVTLAAGGSALVADFGKRQCIEGGIGVSALTVSSGSASFVVDAIYKDKQGNRNSVAIPALGAPLTGAPGEAYEIDGAENASGRRTDIALFPDAPIWVTLIAYDAGGKKISADAFYIAPPYAFVHPSATFDVGRIDIHEGADGIASGVARANLYAVAFVGDGFGSPRVVAPCFVKPAFAP